MDLPRSTRGSKKWGSTPYSYLAGALAFVVGVIIVAGAVLVSMKED